MPFGTGLPQAAELLQRQSELNRSQREQNILRNIAERYRMEEVLRENLRRVLAEDRAKDQEGLLGGNIGAGAGSIIGAIAGIPAGPLGSLIGSGIGGGIGGSVGSAFDPLPTQFNPISTTNNLSGLLSQYMFAQQIQNLINQDPRYGLGLLPSQLQGPISNPGVSLPIGGV